MISEFVKAKVPPQRLEQIRSVRDHLKGALHSSLVPPSGLPESQPFHREAANSIKGVRRVWAGLETAEARDALLMSLMHRVLDDRQYWPALEDPFLRNELGEDLYPFATGAARYGAGDVKGAVAAFEEAQRGGQRDLATVCRARAHVAGADPGTAREVLRAGLERAPTYLPIMQELMSLEFREGRVGEANRLVEAAPAELSRVLLNPPHCENVPGLDAEITGALASKTVKRPAGSRQDGYTEESVEWYWRDIWWGMNGYTRFQNPLAWLRWFYETSFADILGRIDPSLDTFINFGVFCAEPDFQMAKRFGDKSFIGIDRQQATKRMNDAAYQAPNLRFVAGEIQEELPKYVKRGSSMLFHARTGTLCYPQFLRDLYKQCAREGVRTIALFENHALERRSLRYRAFDEMTDDAYPFIQHMFIHNYKRYLDEAGYSVIDVRIPPYGELFHQLRGAGCDLHALVVAQLR